MSTIIEKAFSGYETAFMLRLALGPLREWSDTLADMRRGRTSVAGHVLMPAGHIHARTRRPVYLWSDIIKFIEAVSRDCPTATRKAPPLSKMVIVDPADRRDWSIRFLPAAMMSGFVGRFSPAVQV